jgi:DNA-binding IclR family transcriptional regulator
LADELDNEMVAFAGEEKDQVVAIEIIQSRDGIEYNTMPGMYYPMHCSAAGKAILAHYSSSRVDRIVDQYGLPAFTDRTITTKSELRDELEQIREAGVSYEYGEYHSGMATIAVPVLAPGDTPLGGVSIIGPEHHMSESDVKSELTNLLLSSVNIIELNYAGQED